MASQSQLRRIEAMSVGFAVGSMLFAAGAGSAMLGAPELAANSLYALGAVFFTSAAAVQWRNAADFHPRSRLKDPDWTSSAIQFVGTIMFNVMTIRALVLSMDPVRVPYDKVWRPDVFGSAMFLISSWIAWHPLVRAQRHELTPARSRLICWANMLGSIFFAVSAWGAMLLGPGQFQDPFWSNMGTLLGAIGFLVGAVALFPRRDERAHVSTAT